MQRPQHRAPYRLALFDRLTEDQEGVVLFGLKRSAHRMWATSLDGTRFGLPARVLGLLVLNPGLRAEVVRRRPELVIHSDTDGRFATLLVILAFGRLLCYRLILWVEQVPRTKAALRATQALRHRLQWSLTWIGLSSMTAVHHAAALLSISGAAAVTAGNGRP